MTKRVVAALSTVFSAQGGIPRFNRILTLALDQLAPEMGLTGQVLSQDDSRGDYDRAGSPWRHLEFIAAGGRLGLTLRTVGACAARRPDALLIGLLGMTPLGLLSAPFLRRGYGFVAYGTESWHEGRVSRRVSARGARVAFAISQDTAVALARATGMSPERVRLLPPAVDPSLESAAAAPESAGVLEVLTVARLAAGEGRKGVDHALRAFARVASRHPEARYRIVGAGTDRGRLEALAVSLGQGGRVVLESDLSDAELAERYRRCALFLLPSSQEGAGIAFLEAMRFGRPCIGARAGGTPELIEEGRTGLLVPYGDEAAIETALAGLLGDAVLRQQLGAAGRERALAHFSFERFRDRLRGHLDEWLSAR